MSRIEVVGNLGYRYLTLSPALYVSQPSTQVNFYLKYEEIFKQKFEFKFLSKSQIFSKGIESLPQQLIFFTAQCCRILFDQKVQVFNIKGLYRQDANIQGLEHLSLWQRLNSFVYKCQDKICLQQLLRKPFFREFWFRDLSLILVLKANCSLILKISKRILTTNKICYIMLVSIIYLSLTKLKSSKLFSRKLGFKLFDVLNFK